MSSIKQTRLAGIDIVRFFAIFFVLGIHTMGLLGFGSHNISGASNFFEILVFRLTWMCVPLFLILTGYLNSTKEGNKAYFKSIAKTAVIFLLYSVLVLVFRSVYQHENISLWNGIKMILNNATQDRAWYMNMYFGLVLLVPFINKGWQMFGKKQKLIIILVLYFLTSISKYVFTLSDHYFATPIILVSSYWWGLYYLVYYLIGAFVKEYPINVSKKIILSVFSITIIGHALVYYYAGQGKTFIDIFLAKVFWYDNPVLIIEATLFFLLFYNVDIRSKVAKLVNKEISLSALEMYLFSIITDTICVKYFSPMLAKHSYFTIVALMWITSFTLAFLVTLLRRKVIRFL